jgi:hypothetical protein
LNYLECCYLTIWLIIFRCPLLSWKSYFSLILKLLMLLWFRKLSSCFICYSCRNVMLVYLYLCMQGVAFVSSISASISNTKQLAISHRHESEVLFDSLAHSWNMMDHMLFFYFLKFDPMCVYFSQYSTFVLASNSFCWFCKFILAYFIYWGSKRDSSVEDDNQKECTCW